MSERILFRLLLVLVLAWSGSTAQLHALSHAQHDLAAAAAASGEKAPSPLKHSTDQCLIAHALEGAASEPGTPPEFRQLSQSFVSLPAERRGAAPALAFRSRAPPVLS